MFKWEIRARRFIAKQRLQELTRAMFRYPDSPHYQRRLDEAADLEIELKYLAEQE